MKRRDFVVTSLGAALSTRAGLASASQGPTGPAAGPGAATQVLELRRYRFRHGPMEARHGEYAKTTLVPALNRLGVSPVGAFSVMIGPDSPAVYMLLPHPSADSPLTLGTRLTADPEYSRAAAAFRALPAGDPPYVRRDSTLLAAFRSIPAVELPPPNVAMPSRIFELRVYESHNEAANLKKIEMFEAGGELAIFRRVGITPVFFARTVIGANMPSLTYLVAFPDIAARDKAWTTFREDPAWVKLRETPGYTNAEILSNTHTVLLRPTAYSQI